jgi:hypothetical protein
LQGEVNRPDCKPRIAEAAASKAVERTGLSQISSVDGSSGMAVNFVASGSEGPMILNVLVERLKRRSKDDLSGTGTDYPAPPPQIPACGFSAPGSCRKSSGIDVWGLLHNALQTSE